MIKRNINNILIQLEPTKSDTFFIGNKIDDNKEIEFENISDLARYISGNKYFPIVGSWEITTKCNFSCPFCYIVHSNKSFDTLINWRKLISQMTKSGVLFITLSGGEPFLSYDFIEIYKELKECGFIITIYTNGSYISEEQYELLKTYPPFSIEVSVYGTTEEQYQFLTGNKAFSRVDSNIRLLKKDGHKIVLKTLINKTNYKIWEHIRDYADSLNLDFFFSFNLYPDTNRKSMLNYLAPDKILPFLYLEKSGGIIDFKTKPDISLFSCDAGRYGFHIDVEGNISPCSELRKYSYSVVNDFSFAWVKVKNFVINNLHKRPQKCINCDISGFCKVCAANIENDLTSGTVNINNEICEYYKKLYSGVKEILDNRN